MSANSLKGLLEFVRTGVIAVETRPEPASEISFKTTLFLDGDVWTQYSSEEIDIEGLKEHAVQVESVMKGRFRALAALAHAPKISALVVSIAGWSFISGDWIKQLVALAGFGAVGAVAAWVLRRVAVRGITRWRAS